jgi:hypothetical protein
MEVMSQLHVPVALFPDKELPGIRWAPELVWKLRRIRNFVLLTRIKLRYQDHLDRNQTTMTSVLSRLQFQQGYLISNTAMSRQERRLKPCDVGLSTYSQSRLLFVLLICKDIWRCIGGIYVPESIVVALNDWADSRIYIFIYKCVIKFVRNL